MMLRKQKQAEGPTLKIQVFHEDKFIATLYIVIEINTV